MIVFYSLALKIQKETFIYTFTVRTVIYPPFLQYLDKNSKVTFIVYACTNRLPELSRSSSQIV